MPPRGTVPRRDATDRGLEPFIRRLGSSIQGGDDICHRRLRRDDCHLHVALAALAAAPPRGLGLSLPGLLDMVGRERPQPLPPVFAVEIFRRMEAALCPRVGRGTSRPPSPVPPAWKGFRQVGKCLKRS